MTAARALLAFALVATVTSGAEISPIGKVIEMISDLQAKVLAEGEETQKIYEEAAEFCEDRSQELGFAIKTGKATSEELKAAIGQEDATQAELTAKIEELSGSVATNELDLKAATEIRAKEAADFAAEKAELSEVIDMITRAAAIIEREMSKAGASMLQLKNAGSVAEALRVMVQASVFSSADASTLTALVQSAQGEDAEDSQEPGAPASTVYASHSSGILDTLGSLKDKAESQLEEAGHKETSALNNFEMLKQSLEDAIKFGNKDAAKAQQNKADSGEAKAKAEGDLGVTTKTLDADISSLAELHRDCMQKAQDFENEHNSRGEELNALAEAKKVIVEKTSGADAQSYGLLQVSRTQLKTGAALAQFEAIRFVRDLARKQGSPALAQLATRMDASTNGSGDVFAKIKGLISDMITNLEDQATADAEKKAFCDKELSETNVKHADKTAEIEKLSTNIDMMTSRSAQLKEEVAALQKALAELAKAQAEMDKLRSEEHALFVKNKAEMDLGIEGLKMALKVLREYYAKDDKAHAAADASGVIGLLEVAESDFTKDLAAMVQTEETAQATYEQETKDNEIETATKEQDVKYKSKESTDLDKAVAEATADRLGVQDELDAVNSYLKSLHDKCDEVAETYEHRKNHREAEIAGLKEALTILENETALLQTKSRRYLRAHK